MKRRTPAELHVGRHVVIVIFIGPIFKKENVTTCRAPLLIVRKPKNVVLDIFVSFLAATLWTGHINPL